MADGTGSMVDHQPLTISPQPAAISQGSEGVLGWWHDADLRARRAFVAASLGWMLDSFDVMLYAIVLASLMEDPVLHLTQSTAGILGSATLLAAAAGGIVFGVVADRLGRKRALMAAVLIYSVFTAACGFAQSALQLAILFCCLVSAAWAVPMDRTRATAAVIRAMVFDMLDPEVWERPVGRLASSRDFRCNADPCRSDDARVGMGLP